MNNLYFKTIFALIISFVITWGLGKTVFYEDKPVLRENFAIFTDRLISPIIGGKGQAVQEGVDPTPPAAIYY